MNKVVVDNNWEYRTYFVGDEKLNEKKGGLVDIQWPDGTQEKDVKFVSVKRGVTVYDMGNNYVTDCFFLEFTTTHFGLEFTVSLQDVLVENVRQSLHKGENNG